MKNDAPDRREIARRALRDAAGPDEPDVGRLAGALPEIMAEARRRRAAAGRPDLVAAIVSAARWTIPRLAVTAAVLALVGAFVGLDDAAGTDAASSGIDRYLLTGEVGEDDSDLLLEAIARGGNDHG